MLVAEKYERKNHHPGENFRKFTRPDLHRGGPQNGGGATDFARTAPFERAKDEVVGAQKTGHLLNAECLRST